jgi:hypothetical protein
MAKEENLLRIKHKITGKEMEVTPTAYNILKGRYRLLNGEAPVQISTEKKTVKNAAPVAVKQQKITVLPVIK